MSFRFIIFLLQNSRVILLENCWINNASLLMHGDTTCPDNMMLIVHRPHRPTYSYCRSHSRNMTFVLILFAFSLFLFSSPVLYQIGEHMFQDERVYTLKNKQTGKFFIAQNQHVLLASSAQRTSQVSSFFRLYQLPNGRVLIESVEFPGQFVAVQRSTTSKKGLVLVSREALPSTTDNNLFILSFSEDGCSAALAQMTSPKPARRDTSDSTDNSDQQPTAANERSKKTKESNSIVDSLLAAANSNAAGGDSVDTHRDIVEDKAAPSPVTFILSQFHVTAEPERPSTEAPTTDSMRLMALEMDTNEQERSIDNNPPNQSILDILDLANSQAA